MEKKQTAVEWLIKQLHPTISIRLSSTYIKELTYKAIAIEKEQIIDAHIEGFYSPPFGKSRNGEAEQYCGDRPVLR